MPNSLLIRSEDVRDWADVHAVNVSAFETPEEADLVDALRTQALPIISLVADDVGSIVGHIMFSLVTINSHLDLNIMGLAPMAVVPSHQRQGIGSALVRAGLDRCRELGVDAVVVLGHSDYYTRFGFVPSVRFGIRSEYDVPDDVFMVVELKDGVLRNASGTVQYHQAFNDVT